MGCALDKGFTLIEMVVTIALVGVVMALVTLSFAGPLQFLSGQVQTLAAQKPQWLAAERIRVAVASHRITDVSIDTLTFDEQSFVCRDSALLQKVGSKAMVILDGVRCQFQEQPMADGKVLRFQMEGIDTNFSLNRIYFVGRSHDS